MNILFIHGNYPAQFRVLATELGRQDIHDVRFLSARKDMDKHHIKGVTTINFTDAQADINRAYNSEAQRISEELLNRGQIIQQEIIKLIRSGFTPNIIIFHGGNGIGLFIKQVVPNAITIGYFEWYFSPRCAKLILNKDDIKTLNFIQMRNSSTETEILSSDGCIVPTQWQAQQFPQKLRNYLTIIFDGIDTSFFNPGNAGIKAEIILEGEDDTLKVLPDDILITYATRGMEPLRGFTSFMRFIPKLLERLPNAKILIGGRDRSAYGPCCESHNGSWKEMILDEVPVLKDHSQVIYTGLMTYSNYRKMLQRTNLHCYFTKPYVTSWSLFEAVACGAPILTNKSPATTGTIKIANHSKMLNSIEDISSEDGVKTAVELIEIGRQGDSLLNSEYTIASSMRKWQDLLNDLINNRG